MLDRFRNLIFIVLILAILGGVVLLLTNRPAPVTITILPPDPTVTAIPTATPSPVRVYVTGAVQKPLAIYELPYGSRVEAAITAAGGFTEDADRVAVNMAQLLRDGDQVHVPTIMTVRVEITATRPPDPTAENTTEAITMPDATAIGTASAQVKINSATAAELETLPGVGPVLAADIISYREKNGPFKTMDDLDKVPGIGPATIAKWAGLIIFD